MPQLKKIILSSIRAPRKRTIRKVLKLMKTHSFSYHFASLCPWQVLNWENLADWNFMTSPACWRSVIAHRVVLYPHGDSNSGSLWIRFSLLNLTFVRIIIIANVVLLKGLHWCHESKPGNKNCRHLREHPRRWCERNCQRLLQPKATRSYSARNNQQIGFKFRVAAAVIKWAQDADKDEPWETSYQKSIST